MARPKEFFDPCQLKVGSRIELEHTKSPKVARRIAIDHLRETPDYYTQLCKWHKDSACKLFRSCKRKKPRALGTYYSSAKGLKISRVRADQEVRKHGIDPARDREYLMWARWQKWPVTAQSLLRWLGY